MAQVLDYSAGFPGAGPIKRAGCAGVVRYAGTPGRRKNLTHAEFDELNRAGLAVATVYENQPGDYLGGRAAGMGAAQAWLADVSSISPRLARVGYFAVDRDVVSEWTALAEYFRGINAILGVARTRAYGEADVVDYLVAQGLVANGSEGGQWQTVAWSHGERSPHAALFQRAGQVVVGDIECDVNDVLKADWGQHTYQEDDMQLTDKWDEDAITKQPGTVGHALLNMKQNIAATRQLATAQTAAITALSGLVAKASGGALTADEVKSAVVEAIQENVVHVEVHGVQQDGANE